MSEINKIEWFSCQPTPYNHILFEKISQIPGVLISVNYRFRKLKTHPWESNFDSSYSTRYYNRIIGIDCRTVIYIFRNDIKHFVIAGWDHATTILLLSALRMLGRSYLLWTDTPKTNGNKNLTFIRKLRKIWLNWIFKGATAVFGTGFIGVKRLIEMGSPSHKTFNLPFILDISNYPVWGILEKKFSKFKPLKFISVGRIENELKGHNLAILALVKALGRSDDWLYEIAGIGNDEKKIYELADKLGVNKNIRIIGWCEPDVLIDMMSTCHVLIHPSPVHDPYPNAVLEAMAAGCVIMASDLSGSAIDRIEHFKSGFIHKAGNYEDLASQISFIYQNYEILHGIAFRSRFIAEYWTADRSLDDFLNAI